VQRRQALERFAVRAATSDNEKEITSLNVHIYTFLTAFEGLEHYSVWFVVAYAPARPHKGPYVATCTRLDMAEPVTILPQYPVRDWTEKREESDEAITDESVVYLWDDFVVVRSPVLPGEVIFYQVTTEWQEFWQTTLHFEIPFDSQRYAYEKVEEKESMTEEPEIAQSEAAL
jgi:hypothetical protein